MYSCSHCGSRHERYTKSCPICGLGRSESDRKKTVSFEPSNGTDGFIRLGDIATSGIPRFDTGIEQLNKAFGGDPKNGYGLAYPSVIQLGGQPGIGKSTLLLQMMSTLASVTRYYTAEELPRFIAERAKRLRLPNVDGLRIREESDPEEIKRTLEEDPNARIAIVDSISALRHPVDEEEDGGRARSINHSKQTEAAIALDLVKFALKKDEYTSRRGNQITMIFLCHVVKSDDLAGMKIIEHMVDVVAEFRGERSSKPRVVRLLKNRMGPTYEPARFTMEDDGLHERSDEEEIDDEKYKPSGGTLKLKKLKKKKVQ